MGLSCDCEGIYPAPHRCENTGINDCFVCPFKTLWNSINAQGDYGWDTNPWVWAIEFDVIHANVDLTIDNSRVVA